jgi:processive 1,2-diacylglycerol beta-glucosyltransferase
MRTTKPILIAAVSVGAGHMRAAEAVREAALDADPARLVEAVDVLDLAPPWVRSFYRECFLQLTRMSRRVAYGAYLATDGDTADNVRWGHVAERVLFRRFRHFLRAGRWEDCICTHFLPCQMAYPHARPRMHLVVTDWALHRFWVQPFATNIFVATPEMSETLRRRAPGARTHVTGIPIRSAFRCPPAPAQVRHELALGVDTPVALVAGGGWGLGLEAMVRGVLEARVPALRVEVVCGANAHAYAALSGIAAGVRTHAFVDDVARLVAAADLVVSKAGGVTTSEALALGKPLILTRGVPGNEDRNLDVLTALGVAVEADTTTIGPAVARFFADPATHEPWIAAAAALGRPHAAAHIVAVVDGRIPDGGTAGGAPGAFAATVLLDPEHSANVQPEHP